jgi:hypothetical protein
VARFVYDAVVLHDFRMREHGTGALETYEGELRIGERNWTPTRTRAFIEINLDSCHRFRLSIIVNDICEEREELVEESVEKKTHWYSRKKQFKVTKSKKVSIKIGEEIVIASDGLFHYAENSGNPMTVQNYLQYVREGALEEPGDHIPLLKQFLTTFFNLPRYMHNYLIRTRNEFTDTLDAVSSELAKNDKQVKE